MAIFRKLLSLNVLRRVPEFYSTYKNSVKTDLGLRDLINLLPLATKLTDTSRIHSYFVGPKQVYDWITPGGGMVLLPRPGSIKQLLNKALKE